MRDSNQGWFQQQVRFLRRQFLQDGDLPFTNVLSAEIISQALTLNAGVKVRRVAERKCDTVTRLNPAGRRAVQLGLHGDVLAAYGKRECVEIIDMTAFVAEQRPRATSPGFSQLLTPVERVYRPSDPATVARLGLGMA